jgi:orotate phosphoribosyltransferase
MPVAVEHDRAALKATLLEELERHALIKHHVTLSNGQESDYYVDAKRALFQPPAFDALGPLVLDVAKRLGAAAVGGMSIGADPVAFAVLASDPERQLVTFLVRKQRKAHGMQRWIEGPALRDGTPCLVVDDVVTTGGSTVEAIERMKESGLRIVGALTVLDRLAGGQQRIEAAADAPFESLLTIDDLYPERPDREN